MGFIGFNIWGKVKDNGNGGGVTFSKLTYVSELSDFVFKV